MKRLLAPVLLVATPAIAEEGWHHAVAPMGQYEGRYEAADGTFVAYGCSGIGGSVSVGVKGLHVGPGKGQLLVDGALLYEGSLVYSSLPDTTSFDFDAGPDSHEWQKDRVSKVAGAIAKGSEMKLVSPNGETFTYPLKGSSGIGSCK